jgi:subfamily B ATP-binding cassette protein MsbA
MKNALKIFRYVVPYWGMILLNILCNLLAVFFSLFTLLMIVPFLQLLFGTNKLVLVRPEFAMHVESLKQSFFYFFSKIIVDYGKLEALIILSCFVVVLFLLKNIFRYGAMYILAPIRSGVVRDIRNDIYHKVLILPLAYYSDQKRGDIISRMTADVQEIEWSIMSSLEMLFREPLTIISYLIALFFIGPQLTLMVLILLPLSALVIGLIGKNLRKDSLKVQQKMGSLFSMIEETISGLRIIKAFNAINAVEKKFVSQNRSYIRLMTYIYRKRDLASPLSEFLGATIFVTVLWFGGKLALDKNSSLSPESFIAYLAIFSQIINPAKNFSQAFYSIKKGLASAERVKQVIDAEEVILEKPDAKEIKQFNDSIEYCHVSFSYEKEEVLSNINLKIKKGQTIALVGPSGGGKSTMVDLLPRFYDCSDGEIKIDGIPVKDLIISDLRGLMGIVTQESILFNDSVFNNIAFGMQGVSEEKVIEAAKIANAHDFIMEMEQGYQTQIGDRGSKLSGGQKQRISIARAVLKNPPVLILDEATSALDTESERLVQDALTKLLQNRTSVIVAHRLSTIQHADEIVVIQQGKIAERGTHNELIAKDGLYKRLYDLQAF